MPTPTRARTRQRPSQVQPRKRLNLATRPNLSLCNADSLAVSNRKVGNGFLFGWVRSAANKAMCAMHGIESNLAGAKKPSKRSARSEQTSQKGKGRRREESWR